MSTTEIKDLVWSKKWSAMWTKSRFNISPRILWIEDHHSGAGLVLPVPKELGRGGWSKQSEGGYKGTEGDTVVRLVGDRAWGMESASWGDFCRHHQRTVGELTRNPALIPTPKPRQGKAEGH